MKALPRNKLPKNPKLLIIKLRSIGDVIYNTAVYTPLKKSFPGSHLSVLVEPASYDIVKHHPAVDEVLCFEKKSLLGQVIFYYNLFKNRYNVVIDMHEGTRGAVMCFITLASFRVGHRFAKRSFLYNVKLEFGDLQPKYPIDYQVALIRKMGVKFEKITPIIYISEAAKENAAILLRENGISNKDSFCILHPGARIFDRWEAWKFAKLADRVFELYNLKILLTWGSGQKELVDQIIPKIKNAPYVLLSTKLQELGAITQRAKFAVCHNGGYMHMASALGTPVVGMFGWANPNIWKPIGRNSEIVYKNLECSPCHSKTIKSECLAGYPECKRLITVDDVMLAVKRAYSPYIKLDS
jgi:ADP-heptose:LPS heptosyltransferase